MLSIWVLVTGLGDLGRINEIESAADAGYQLAEKSAEASHLRLPLAAVQVIAYRLAGALTSLDAMIARIGRDTIDVPFQQAWHSLFAGLSAMSRGDLPAAQRSLQEAIAHLENGGGGRMTKTFARSWLAAVTAYGRQSSRRATGARGHRAIPQGTPRPARGTSSDSLPRHGRVPPKALRRRRSRSSVTQRRTNPSAAGPPGKSCFCRRRHNLATTPPPRDWRSWPASSKVPAQPPPPLMPPHLRREAGTHSSTRHVEYEAFGDRIAAADAAAHAVVAYRDCGSRGAALSASATAQRLAAECQGAQTPALRAATTQSFTPRQREIIALAAQGLSNKEVADRLTMSIRSVEGHLFRASQRVGANSREELISILRGH